MLKRRFKRNKRVGYGIPDPQTTSLYHDKKINEIYNKVHDFKNPKQIAYLNLFSIEAYDSFSQLYNSLHSKRKFVEHLLKSDTDTERQKKLRENVNGELSRLGYSISNATSIIIKL